MDKKAFRADWYFHDAFIDFCRLKADEIGVLMQIINLIYIHNAPIDNDPKFIGKHCNINRSTSVSRADLIEIAEQTHLIAKNKGEAVSVMWFCDIPEEVGIGKILPWFAMKPETKRPDKAAPIKKPFLIRNGEDIQKASEQTEDHILVLEPEVPLIRDEDDFLKKIIVLAKEKNLPVQIQGSTLGHA